MFTVNTHGNRHRLTIVATDTRGQYPVTFRLDTGKAGQHEDSDWCELLIHDGGATVELDWKLIAAMIAKAYRSGRLLPKHVYRVPAWNMMPDKYQLMLFKLFNE